MREIKFRAWNEKTKKMSVPFSLDWFIEDHPTTPDDWDTDGTWSPDTTFLQYTGLKDKDGKEIYEGDIIRFAYLHEDSLGTVDFDERLAHFNAYNYQHGEVIGNIHENPELLE